MSAHCCSPATLVLLLPSAVALTAFLGSWHCLGMCGGLIVSTSQTRSGLLVYHLGRWLSYSGLGFLVGLLGAWIGGHLPPIFTTGVSIALSAVLIFNGVQQLRNQQHALPELPFLKFAFRSMPSGSPLIFSGLAGFLSAFLPCGFLYSIVSALAVTGKPLFNVVIMSAFWAGTLPVLSLGPGLLRFFVQRYSQLFPKILGILLILTGLFSIFIRS